MMARSRLLPCRGILLGYAAGARKIPEQREAKRRFISLPVFGPGTYSQVASDRLYCYKAMHADVPLPIEYLYASASSFSALFFSISKPEIYNDN